MSTSHALDSLDLSTDSEFSFTADDLAAVDALADDLASGRMTVEALLAECADALRYV